MTRDELVEACQKVIDAGALTAEALAAGLIEAGVGLSPETRDLPLHRRLIAFLGRNRDD